MGYRFLNRCARLQGRFTWVKTDTGLSRAVSAAFAVLLPVLQARAKRFARDYFTRHGQAIVKMVRADGFDLSVEQLERSVDH